jgi:hypothetical protein
VACSLPRISSDKKLESYITSTANGPQIDASHFVTDSQRKLADSFRVVEDPIIVKKKKEEVCLNVYLYLEFDHSSMRKIIQILRDAECGPVLGTALHPMMSYYHSYTEKRNTIIFIESFYRPLLTG